MHCIMLPNATSNANHGTAMDRLGTSACQGLDLFEPWLDGVLQLMVLHNSNRTRGDTRECHMENRPVTLPFLTGAGSNSWLIRGQSMLK